jgi:hypothetical protein
MHAALHGLVENSYYRHRIIVIVSHAATPATDFEIVDGKRQRTFVSLDNYFTRHAEWLTANGVEIVYVDSQTFRDKHYRSEPTRSGNGWEGGVDTAFKNNCGLDLTVTEWTIPNWDADFYPAKHWDKPIFDYIRERDPRNEYLVPMHVQPALPDAVESCHRLAIPTAMSVDGFAYVTSPKWESFADCHAQAGQTIREPCGARAQLHWVPWILRTSDIRSIGGFSYMGSGYDLEFDNEFGRRGFTKVGFCDSFVLHKGYVLPACQTRLSQP